MKHFVIAVILLAVIVGCVIANGCFVRKFVNNALELTKNLPETREEFDSYTENIQHYVDKWYRRHGFLSLSIHMCELERVCEAVADIKACFQTKSYENYIQAKRRLEAALDELADGEKPSFVNIF
ncbi:MAG: DUF4363 family protein [Clostridiales bacterium]|jgi:hypothetical protein|nr:DUF4363 family protein [Clostridiales bacterium]